MLSLGISYLEAWEGAPLGKSGCCQPSKGVRMGRARGVCRVESRVRRMLTGREEGWEFAEATRAGPRRKALVCCSPTTLRGATTAGAGV